MKRIVLLEALRANRVTTFIEVSGVFGQLSQAARIHEKLATQVGENGQNPPVVNVGLGKPQFAEDVLDMLLDRAFCVEVGGAHCNHCLVQKKTLFQRPDGIVGTEG